MNAELRALAERRETLRREREALDADVAAFAASGTASMIEIAKALGVSRQAVYKMRAISTPVRTTAASRAKR